MVDIDNYFESILFEGVTRCEDRYYFSEKNRGIFSLIYPFTTENISGYLDFFDLNNKSLLTVGSSGDQVINAALYNCKDITVIDICPFSKYYFYLKKAAIMMMSYEEYFNFFCYKDYPEFCRDNKSVFEKKKFEEIKSLLRLLDFESFLFWDEIFSLFDPITVRKNLFLMDEDRAFVLKGTNLYLKDEEWFNKAKKMIRDINPRFIVGNIFEIDVLGKYDNIFLSNIAQYHDVENVKPLLDKLNNSLNDDGRMLVSYLYDMTVNTVYNEEWANIYDVDKSYSVLGDYLSSLETFCGVRGLLFEDEEYAKDSIFLYDKAKVKGSRK